MLFFLLDCLLLCANGTLSCCGKRSLLLIQHILCRDRQSHLCAEPSLQFQSAPQTEAARCCLLCAHTIPIRIEHTRPHHITPTQQATSSPSLSLSPDSKERNMQSSVFICGAVLLLVTLLSSSTPVFAQENITGYYPLDDTFKVSTGSKPGCVVPLTRTRTHIHTTHACLIHVSTKNKTKWRCERVHASACMAWARRVHGGRVLV